MVDRRNWQPSSERLGRRARSLVSDSLVVNISKEEQEKMKKAEEKLGGVKEKRQLDAEAAADAPATKKR